MNRNVMAVSIAICCFAGSAFAAGPQRNQGSYVPKSERAQAAGQIIRKWSNYVGTVYGTQPMEWARAMQGTFAEADMSNLKAAAERQTYEGMMGTLMGQVTTDAQVIDTLSKSDGSLAAVKALGSPASDLVYTMVAPCRIMDSRVAGGRLSGGVARGVAVHGTNFVAQGGASNTCGIPADPSAVAINVVAVTPDQNGFMTIYPAGTARPAASNMNYLGGGILANEIIAKTTLGQATDLDIFSQYATDVVVDIVGYFMAPEATALQCTTVTASRSLAAGFTGWNFATADCPTGYTPVAAYCWEGSSTATYLSSSGINPTAFCGWKNLSGGVQTVFEGNRCCRVPGR